VASVVLLAPAFDLAARWQERMPPLELARWRNEGAFAFDHHARGRKEELAIGFLDDAARHQPFPLPAAPTLVLQGTRDEVVDPLLAREFTSRMQGRARLVEIPDGHELTADLPRLWREMEVHLAPYLGPER
jgi:pimeloyl-ACP methyl ester carboxylesterase